MNIYHHDLHDKTNQGHMCKIVQACNAVASEREAASVSLIIELHSEFETHQETSLTPPGWHADGAPASLLDVS
ncbi:hypothetical protein HPB48_015637 [Haemaphysalis longicornis]|uniref:Uncharacterized protein n=1 Tax=Haemaphysalis longicornis TaxID=44386 RepID=A0A9J6GC09_HAELO|nr:hypothetical protein HPB48_015637 [Haemaphysalis longicornis]